MFDVMFNSLYSFGFSSLGLGLGLLVQDVIGFVIGVMIMVALMVVIIIIASMSRLKFVGTMANLMPQPPYLYATKSPGNPCGCKARGPLF